jgi:hypothetical protein
VYDLSVKAVDGFGFPISRALVLVELANGTVVSGRTDEGGKATFPLVPGGRYVVEVHYLWQRAEAASHTSISTSIVLKIFFSLLVTAVASGVIVAVVIALALVKKLKLRREHPQGFL